LGEKSNNFLSFKIWPIFAKYPFPNLTLISIALFTTAAMTQRHTVEIWTNVRPTLVRSVLESDLVRTEQVARYLVTLWILRPWIFRVKTWLFRFYSSCLLVASRTRCRIEIRDGSIFAFSIWQIFGQIITHRINQF
jgi:hypothetical protein